MDDGAAPNRQQTKVNRIAEWASSPETYRLSFQAGDSNRLFELQLEFEIPSASAFRQERSKLSGDSAAA